MKFILLILFSFCLFDADAQMDTIKSGNLTIIQDTAVTKLLNVKISPLKPKTMKGFRLQLVSSANRTEVINMKVSFMKAYPNVRAYLTYNQPYFKLRVGDFQERTDANGFMDQIYSQFPGFIVEDVINTDDPNNAGQNKPQK